MGPKKISEIKEGKLSIEDRRKNAQLYFDELIEKINLWLDREEKSRRKK